MRRALLLALLLGGCVAASDEDPARTYSLADLRDLAKAHGDIDGIPAEGMVAFRGQPIAQLSPPFSNQEVLQRPDLDGAPLSASFSEGAPAAYYTTEFWYDRDPVWVEPLYIAVSAYDPQSPFSKRIPGVLPIFSLGAKSAFYSPYWRVEYVVVPPEVNPDSLRHVRDVVGLETHDGPLKICSIIPDDMDVASPEGVAPVRPLNGDAVAAVRKGQAWVEGEKVSFLDFGNDRFTVGAGDVVDETPIYGFAAADEGGERVPLGLPNVAGVGPAGSQASVSQGSGAVRFGGLWRLYLVDLPAGAGVFVPPGLPALRDQVREKGLAVPELAAEVAADPRAADYTLRVALDPSCFGSTDGGFPGGCTWLDSQARIESLLGQQAIHRTEVTITCPLVEFGGEPVTP